MSNELHPMSMNPSMVLIAPLFRPRGGRQTTRQEIRKEEKNGRYTNESKVTVVIPNVDERKRAEKLVQSARDTLRKYTTKTIIGILADKSNLADLADEIGAIRAQGDTFNRSAITCQVEITYLPIEISVALGPEAARALADHVHTELSALHTALREGRMKGDNGAHGILHRVKNLHLLAVGVQSDAIKYAVQEGKTRLKDLRDAITNSETPESAGRALDLSMIENGIVTFTYDPTAQTEDLNLEALEG